MSGRMMDKISTGMFVKEQICMKMQDMWSNFGYLGRMYGINNLISGVQKRSSNIASNQSYKDILASFQEKSVSGNNPAENVSIAKSAAEMTMEEYQSYIWNKIDSFPFSPTRPFDEETIKISDKCWKRMKEDPAYEQKMMDLIRDGRQYADPFFGMGSSGTYWVLEFDGGEGCYSHGFSKNYGGNPLGARKQFDKESEGGFWTTRAKKAKLQAEINEKYYEQRDMLKRIGEHRAILRDIQARQQGLLHTSSDMPIMGVPAELLLAGLMGGMSIK